MKELANRLGLVSGYFSPSRNLPCAMRDVLKGALKSPCTRRGPGFIESIAAPADHLAVQLRAIDTPLYWPRVLPRYDLYKVVTECFCEDDWQQICHFLRRLVPEYAYRPKGISYNGASSRPIMIHLWVVR